MVKRNDDPNSFGYWLGRGVAKAAEYIARRSDNAIQVINALRKDFKGISMKLAGEAVRTAVAALKSATLRSLGQEPPSGDIFGVPIRPDIFPHGRMGQRFRYTIEHTYTPVDAEGNTLTGAKPMHRTSYVTSPRRLSNVEIYQAAYENREKMLAHSPGAKGAKDSLDDYAISDKIVAEYRSH